MGTEIDTSIFSWNCNVSGIFFGSRFSLISHVSLCHVLLITIKLWHRNTLNCHFKTVPFIKQTQKHEEEFSTHDLCVSYFCRTEVNILTGHVHNNLDTSF